MAIFISAVRADLYYVGCGWECVHNLWSFYSIFISIDCLINVFTIHLSSGFQRKNYYILCQKPHDACAYFCATNTKQTVVKQLNEKNMIDTNKQFDYQLFEENSQL